MQIMYIEIFLIIDLEYKIISFLWQFNYCVIIVLVNDIAPKPDYLPSNNFAHFYS